VTGSIRVRLAALAGAALVALAVVVVLVVVRPGGHSGPAGTSGVGEWYSALAAAYAPNGSGRSACGVRIGPNTVGVAHPVLPCGAKLVVRYGSRTVLTKVVDRGPSVPGREFDLTRALARKLRLQGTQTIRWRFAR
jgi:rare lipoprotein A (peptidoglycan hydrolase)